MKSPCILVAGGDKRHSYAAEKLSTSYDVYTYNMNPRGNCIGVESLRMYEKSMDCLLLPLMTNDEIYLPCCNMAVDFSDLASCLKQDAFVMGGRLSTKQIEYFSALGFDITDYFKREDLIIRNCIPTAVGALQLAMENMDKTINGSNVLITGFGRVVKECARLFKACGANCVVSDRKPSALDEIESYGCKAADFQLLDKLCRDADLIINTVPQRVLDYACIKQAQKSCVIIDLASKPGGVDLSAADNVGLKTIWALGLPDDERVDL